MNPNPDTILPFRFGGMRKALDFDARIVQLVFRGNQTVWPRKAAVGGLPGVVRYSFLPVAPEGARAFVQRARQEHVEEELLMPDHALLAVRTRRLMQEQYDGLKMMPLARSEQKSLFRRLLMIVLLGRSLHSVHGAKSLSASTKVAASRLRSRL